jgi:DNA modification methylase
MHIVNQEVNDRFAWYNADCCEAMLSIPDKSIGLSVFSPPFAELYSYSNSERDMGNSANYDEFFDHFSFLISQLSRVTMPGRIVAVHCIDIPAMKERDGYIGLKDFPGDIIRAFQKAGMIYHSRHVIWKDPLIEATRTKALGLMHKQLCKDSTKCRSGLPDYLLAFRAIGENSSPVGHESGLTHYAGSSVIGGDGVKRSHNIWRAYASPVWMDIRQTNTLNRTEARDADDEKHICPLQLDVIDRCLSLWSAPGDVVLSPFGGIASEGYCAVLAGRKFIGIELKESYWRVGLKNLMSAVSESGASQQSLF